MSGEIDLSQFHEVFFEESFENLEAMESGLLSFSDGMPEPEQINTVFRAAHSIKGGAATFGFLVISEFTHVVETLLDQVRAGERSVTSDFVDIMLESVDLIRSLLTDSRSGNVLDDRQTQELIEKLNSLQATVIDEQEPEENQQGNSQSTGSESGSSTGSEWRIRFIPNEDMLKSGNEPFRMIRELKLLGELAVESSCDRIPSFGDYDPESCFLEWVIVLKGDVGKDKISEVFEWVEGDCVLEIEQVLAQSGASDFVEGEQQVVSAVDADLSVLPKTTGSSDQQVGKQDLSEPAVHFNRRAEDRVAQSQESSSIRVNISKIDSLIDLVGELVITQSMLNRFTKDFKEDEREKLVEGIEQLERNTRELQEHTMRIRMLPIDFVFQRLPRLVRDLGQSLGKQAELNLEGSQTEVDKTVLEKITDPLTHLIRNALDHGIESPEERKRLGKNAVGTVAVKAYHEGATVIIQVEDDGKGLDPEVLRSKAIERRLISEDDELSDIELKNLIFEAGFSTAALVSDVSGRGVGMDVVNNNIKDLGGVVDVYSELGVGSIFTIKLPLTLAILDGQLIRVGKEVFIISMLNIIKSVRISADNYGDVAGEAEVYRFRGEYVPIVRLSELYAIEADYKEIEEAIMVVVDIGQKFGILVDEVLGQQQVVIKSLESNYRHVPSIAGATILGDGKVAMILDPAGLLSHSHDLLQERDIKKTISL